VPSSEVWTGLDPGGVEHLWQPEVLMAGLRVLAEHEPFNHGDPQSPIYEDLRRMFPSSTWYSWGPSGDFRPIFRRSNPWIRLGLVVNSEGGSTVTPVGQDLLNGSLSIEEVFTIAAASHRESNGFPSFARLALSFILVSPQSLSIDQIIVGILQNCHEDGKIVDQIGDVPPESVTSNDRRRRAVRAMLNVLIATRGIIEIAEGERRWRASDLEVLKQIAQLDPRYSIEIPPQERGTGPIVRLPETEASTRSGRRPVRNGFQRFDPSSRASGGRTVRVRASQSDPIRQALLLERANRTHQELVEIAAARLEDASLEPMEDIDSFDLAVFSGRPCLIEVKSIHSENTQAQVRKAVSQLLEYRWRHASLFESSPQLLLLTNSDPTDYLIPGYQEFLEVELGIRTLWQSEQDFCSSHFEGLVQAI
jgi:hypothetical protein